MTPHDTAADALVSWSREEAEKVIAADQWLAEQPAQPWGYHAGDGSPAHPAERVIQWPEYNRARMVHPVYAAPVERPLTDEAVGKILLHCHAIPPGVSLVRLNGDPMDFAETMAAFARAIERAHGIGQPAGATK